MAGQHEGRANIIRNFKTAAINFSFWKGALAKLAEATKLYFQYKMHSLSGSGNPMTLPNITMGIQDLWHR
jgi:hypothetical protein